MYRSSLEQDMFTSARQRRNTPAHPAMNSSSTGMCFWYVARQRRLHCTLSPAHRSKPCAVVSDTRG